MAKDTAKPPKKFAKKKIGLQSEIVYLCSCCAAIILLTLVGVNLNHYLSNNQVLGATTNSQIKNYESLSEEKIYWQNFLKENPGYIDGWLELTQINLDMSDKLAAKESYNNAREIDPISIKLTPFKEVFGE